MPDTPTVLPARTNVVADGPSPGPVTGVFLGPGLAYEAVSLASAMVVQDATSLMRQFSSLTTAALAVITEQLIANKGAPPWPQLFNDVTTNMVNAGLMYVQIGNAAATTLSYFQPGAKVPAPPAWAPYTPPKAE